MFTAGYCEERKFLKKRIFRIRRKVIGASRAKEEKEEEVLMEQL